MNDEKNLYIKGFIQHYFLKKADSDLSSTNLSRKSSAGIYPAPLSRKAGAGFTLIEIIIVISVLAVLSVAGIAAFASYSRAQTLNAAAGDLAVMLNLAKSRAYSQIKIYNAFCTVNTSLEGYEVRICGGTPSCVDTPAGTSFALYMRCGGFTKISTANFSNSNLTFISPPPTVYSFFFPVLKGGVAGNGTVTIKNTFNETRTVTVDSSGNIRIN